jgi:hypothetical protein
MASSISHPVSHERWRLGALWAGVLTGPTVWLVLLEVNYVLAYVACEQRATWFMHLAVGVGLILVAAAGYAAWTASYGNVMRAESPAPPHSDDTRIQRSHWMSRAGIALSVWFMVVILAMEIPIAVLEECQ